MVDADGAFKMANVSGFRSDLAWTVRSICVILAKHVGVSIGSPHTQQQA